MLLSLAEWERETIRDRIKAGVDRAAAEGRTGGQAAGVVTGESEGCQEFPGQRRVGQRRGQDLRGEPAHGARRQGRDLRGQTGHCL